MDYETYQLIKSSTRGEQISFTIEPLNSAVNHALSCSNRLLYVVTNNKKFLYVGEAKGKLKTRLQRGFNAYRHYKRTDKARNGYKGYKWIAQFADSEDSYTVHAFIFPEAYNEPGQRAEVEAIEGELVYLIRQKQGKWPFYQNEIHFSNTPTSGPIAEKAFDIIAKNLR